MQRIVRPALLATLLAGILAAGGCTVRPLLVADATVVTATTPVSADRLSGVLVEDVDTRYAQQVRNHLVFLLYGGRGTPLDTRYSLDLAVTRNTATAARVQVGGADQPTASTLTLTSRYRLRDAATGALLVRGERAVTAAYDVPRQNYAALRAERDAEDRAARELAEVLRLAVAQDLARIDVQ
ncbi:LPS assembly lipoprotein LptE [Aquibium sp. A9E412]|uniref:LPS assembly lipoprotein LptE n=1 Tax=Aquibium sp. A9E412 TaxID=2976767 RepID=UPI0025B22F29|nr:LPS assembly lipoprotein LptE [Aquibium sp. A9E412]MDN2568442.1 LPS assembly lipoprotein LptE [Aquibium sp. A9E412]